ncbi:MAG: sensor histidine kinase [Eubacterium sp.]
MMYFDSIAPLQQTVILTFMYLLLLLSIACIGVSKFSRHRSLIVLIDSAIFVILFILTNQLGEFIRQRVLDNNFKEDIIKMPVWAILAVVLVSAVWLVFQFIISCRQINNTLGRLSVKYALDTLPGAICYFNPDSTVKLCNLQMHRLVRSLTQSDLQSLGELQKALDECDLHTGIIKLSPERHTYLFPDGKVWKYQQTQITARDGVTYTESLFSDVTQIYNKHCELNRKNAELKAMYRDIKHLSDNVLEMTRESEILSAKTNLHDQMGAGIVAIRQSLQQNHTSKENDDAIELFFNAVKVIKNDNNSPVGRSDLEEFIHNASVVGIKVKISGSLPVEDYARSLFLQAMKECCTNAVRHAGAGILFVNSEKSGSSFILTVSNDGKPPADEVIPKGGLLNLSCRLAEYGGKMKICSRPEFLLTVTVPEKDYN